MAVHKDEIPPSSANRFGYSCFIMSGREYETGYQALGSFVGDDDPEAPPSENIVHDVPDKNRARWNHIEDLDEFFTRVYQYYQRNGFVCMVLQDILQLIQYIFVVLFSVFLIKCVDYQILFYEKDPEKSHKVTFEEAIIPAGQCVARFDPLIVICLIVAGVFFLFRLIKIVYNIFKYYEIRAFYTIALKITSADQCNMTWHDVQVRLIEVQQEQQMCIHKQELTELDIYHRILRFKNYMIAMVNKSLLPSKCRIPFVGDYVFLSTGLKYNLEMILFWGPWSPFENNWHLKADYRNSLKRKELANYMAARIFWIGVANLVLSPLIFLWQILYSFFRYAEVLKREPGALGSRRWSLYARLYLRHFNELDHEFNARLNRAYKPAEKYMNIFTSPILVILAKHIAFFAGAFLAVFVILTMVDEDFLAVQHVIAAMTLFGVVVTICSSVIPDEHMVWCPELLMKNILAHIHYMPDRWKGDAHTTKVRDEFALLFHYKLIYLFEELLSPLLTPFILCFGVRHKAQEIVDFYRNFTVEVTGVGDVCSFAQMDIRKHGNPQWNTEPATPVNNEQQAENGKTELSLMHFTLTNPRWKPGGAESMFIQHLKGQAQRDANTMSVFPGDNPLINSLHSLSSVGYGYTSMITSMTMQGGYPPPGGPLQSPAGVSTYSNRSDPTPLMSNSGVKPVPAPLRGGLRNAEGPVGGSQNGLLASLQLGANTATSLMAPSSADFNATFMRGAANEEICSTEMSFSALYMHQLHHQKRQQPYFDNLIEMHERSLWQNPNETPPAGSDRDVVGELSHEQQKEGEKELCDIRGTSEPTQEDDTTERGLGNLYTPFGGNSSGLPPLQAPQSLGPIFSSRMPMMPNIQETEEDKTNEHQPLLMEPDSKNLSKSS